MKRIAIGILGLSLMLGLSVLSFAQDANSQAAGTSSKKVQKAEKKEAKAAAKDKAMHLTGWVKGDSFVNDKDKQTYTVQNADVLKPHEGKHVKVKATLDPSAKTMTVDSVKDMRASKQAKMKTTASQ
jgi:hypothetical protein